MRVVPDDLWTLYFLRQVSFLAEVALIAWLRQQERRRWRFGVLCRRLGLRTPWGALRYTLPMWAANKLAYRGVVETGWRQPGDRGGGSQRWVSLKTGKAT